jgi:hypothetical protein
MYNIGLFRPSLNTNLSFENIELLTPEEHISKQFEKADLDARADIIDKLWHKIAFNLAMTCHSQDISQDILTGLKLYNIMRCAGQADPFSVKLNETALQVFNAAAQGRVGLAKMDNQAKAEFFAMACQFIALGEHEDGLCFVEERYGNLLQLLPIPNELSVVIKDNPLIDSNLLDIAVDLLAATNNNVQATTTLLYNPILGQKVLLVAHYLKELAQASMDNAQHKLGLLRQGQLLMIPMKSSPFDSQTQAAGDGHFSAVVAVRAEKSYQFFILDSKGSADQSDNITIVIDCLMDNLACEYGNDVVADYHIYNCRQYLLFNNECGVHAYEFFKICTKAIEHAKYGISHHIFENAFKQYTEHVNYIHLALKEDNSATSKCLRIEFVLDCIKNGYVADMLFDVDTLRRLYKRIGPDEQTVEGVSRAGISKLMRRFIRPLLKSSA